MDAQPLSTFRFYSTIFAAVLGLQAAWLIAAELTRPELPFFPVNAAQSNDAATHDVAAAVAATIGWPRGSLWIDRVMSANGALIGSIEDGIIPARHTTAEEDYRVAETAALLAPSDARAWLLLAMLSEQSAPNSGKAQAQLKMSYYTASYNEQLFPLRIQIGARLANLDDNELRSFIEYELSMILRLKPELKRSIELAFHSASTGGRQFLEAMIAKSDPEFLSKLKMAKPPTFQK